MRGQLSGKADGYILFGNGVAVAAERPVNCPEEKKITRHAFDGREDRES